MKESRHKRPRIGNSLAVQWLGLLALTAEGLGSIPVQGTKIPQATQHGQKKKEATYYMIPFLGNIQNRQIHRGRKQIGGCQGLGEGEVGE